MRTMQIIISNYNCNYTMAQQRFILLALLGGVSSVSALVTEQSVERDYGRHGGVYVLNQESMSLLSH